MPQRIQLPPHPGLAEHERFADLATAVASLREKAEQIAHQLRGRTVWMVNSTAQGGGVSEMLPGMIGHLEELGIAAEWVVIDATDPEFFALTKRLHNMIHGATDGALGEAERTLFETTNRNNADTLRGWLHDGDILVVHDPQPMPIAAMLRASLQLTCIWRCHIGLDEKNDATKAAWRFLQPYAQAYHHAVFSAPEYVVSYLEGRSSIIYPSLDPLSEKNRPLHDVAGILARAGLRSAADAAEQPFPQQALRLGADGTFAPATEGGEIGLLDRPIVTQISRWDRLKGFLPLLHGFARLKQRLADEPPADVELRRRLQLVRLVLAGPDPDSIADDPEGNEVLAELRTAYRQLDEQSRADIAILSMPMHNPELNALMINALQHASTIVVQNSLREGFGLTLTEAMWKGIPVLSNSRACGPRQQVRGGVDGVMISDPENVDAIASALADMLSDTDRLAGWGRSARQRVRDHFLIYTQLRHWFRLLSSLARTPS